MFIKTSSIKLQNLEQMASVEPVDELQERVARYVDERLGLILREVNRLDDLLGTVTIERTLLGEQLHRPLLCQIPQLISGNLLGKDIPISPN